MWNRTLECESEQQISGIDTADQRQSARRRRWKRCLTISLAISQIDQRDCEQPFGESILRVKTSGLRVCLTDFGVLPELRLLASSAVLNAVRFKGQQVYVRTPTLLNVRQTIRYPVGTRWPRKREFLFVSIRKSTWKAVDLCASSRYGDYLIVTRDNN